MPLYLIENRRQPRSDWQFGKATVEFFPDWKGGAPLTIAGDFLGGTSRPTNLQEATNSMISKCANPSCSKLLMRLDGGRFFGFPTREKNAIEHFWLCLNCSKEFTLKLSEGRVELTQRQHKKIA